MTDGRTYERDNFDWWRDRLDGKNPPIHDIPMQGYYALKRSAKAMPEPVAIWYKDGQLRSKIGSESRSVEWLSVCRNPIEYDVYKSVVEGAPWPHEIRLELADGTVDSTLGGNAASDEDQLLGNIEEWTERGKKALKQGSVDTQEEADALSDIATKLAELCDAADRRRTDLIAPHLEAQRSVNTKFNGRINPGKTVVRDLKTKAAIWIRNEQRRREAEAKALQEEAEAKAGAGEATPKVTAAPVRAGTRGRTVALVKRTVVAYDDDGGRQKAALHLLTKNVPDFTEAMDKAVLRLLRAGDSVPGAKVDTVETAR